MTETLETENPSSKQRIAASRPKGLCIAFSGARAVSVSVPVGEGGLSIGRITEGFAALEDSRLSRDHAILTRVGDEWRLRDLQSRNGSFLGGLPVRGEVSFRAPAVLRVGKTLAVVLDSLPAPFDNPGESAAVGPTFRHTLAMVERLATDSTSLLIQGESGTGKELAAESFRAGGPHAMGPFVAVNCATIPHGVAERLLFGATRGAYSGANTDTGGYLQAADGGVLLFDEIGELEPEVQAKLLRVLETGEVFALGASRPTRIRVRYVFATHRDLTSRVSAGLFRADLYYRIAGARVVLPPLRERPADIPWLVELALRGTPDAPPVHPELVEACMLRPWPGNVRELLQSVRNAAARAREEGAQEVSKRHLDPAAGAVLQGGDSPRGEGATPGPTIADAAAAPRAPELTRGAIEAALEASRGNLAAAARALGVTRPSLYRRMREHGVAGSSHRKRPGR